MSPIDADLAEVRRVVMEGLAGFRARVSRQILYPVVRVDLARTEGAFRDAASGGWGG